MTGTLTDTRNGGAPWRHRVLQWVSRKLAPKSLTIYAATDLAGNYQVHATGDITGEIRDGLPGALESLAAQFFDAGTILLDQAATMRKEG